VLTVLWCSLDRALSAIEAMDLNNFDGQGSLAPEKTEVEADVVGTASLKEQLWRAKQEREALKTRSVALAPDVYPFAAIHVVWTI